MLRFIASLFTSNSPNTKPTDTTSTTSNVLLLENSRGTIIDVTTTETEEIIISTTTEAEHSKDIFDETIFEETEKFEEEDVSFIQSLRQQQKQELMQKILLRRISHQAIMNYYAQDHLPLSQVQEKLEEDNLPLIVLQEKLKQRDSISTYTTTRENINFLLYNNPPRRLLTRSRKPKPTPDTSAPKDDRDYDVWDDAIIGRLMNLIDTIGTEDETSKVSTKMENDLVKEVKEAIKEMEKEVLKEMEVIKEMEVLKEMEVIKEKEVIKEIEKEIIKEVKEEVEKEQDVAVKEVIKEEEKEPVKKEDESSSVSDNESYTFSEESADDIMEDDDKETIIAESSSVETVGNNIWDKTKRESVMMAEEIINFSETINIADSLKISSNESLVKNTLVNKRSSRAKIDSGYGENSISISASNTKREGGRFSGRRRRPMFPLGQTIPKNIAESLMRNNNMNRRSSIHSKKSYENDISRHSSVSSKFSITTGVITEEPEEEDFDNINYRNKFFTAPKRSPQKSNKSLHFLRNLWKSNQPLAVDGNGVALSNKETVERYYQQDNHDAKPDHELKYHANLQRSKEGSISSTGSAQVNLDQGYSNFYLAMPNGKWMVRTRTGSRKITGTQYVDKEYI